MSTPDFSKPSGGSDPYGPPPGSPQQPGYGQTGYGAPAGQGGYGAPGFGDPSGAPAPYGTAPYGSAAGAVVGPGGEWLGPPLAGWGTRLGGYLIDAIITGAVVLGLGLISPDLSTLGNLALLLGFGYLTGTTGQTPGRKAVGIKVLRIADGQVLGAGAGIGRQFLHILDALPLLLGYLWPIWDKKNQTFADKIIGSVVVKV